MRFLIASTVGLLTCTAPLLAQNATLKREAEIVYATAYLKSSATEFPKFVFEREVSRKTLESIPDTSGGFAMIGLNCKELELSGRLRKCGVRAEPDSEALRVLGERIAKELRVEKNFARPIVGDLNFTDIQVRVINSAKPVWNGPCWMPTCHWVPGPPPPPPPPENGPQ